MRPEGDVATIREMARVLRHGGRVVVLGMTPRGGCGLAVHVPNLPTPALAGTRWFARSFAIVRPRPFAASNPQSITLLP